MKKISIIYSNPDNREAMRYIEQQIQKIFEGFVTVEPCYFDQLQPGDKIHADALLLNGKQLLTRIRPYIEESGNLIVLTRSISRKHLPELLQIPKNEDVLLVNDTPESTMETLYMFYELGIFHFNLIPYRQEEQDSGCYSKIRYAVTPQETGLVPPEVKHVIDIGYRQIGSDTLMRLVSVLHLENETVNSNLIRHLQNVVEPNTYAHNSYLESYTKSLILNELISDSGFAILAFDAQGNLLFENQKARNIFKGKASEALSALPEEECRNFLFTVGDSNYLLDRISLGMDEQKLGYIISLQDEHEIHEAENQLNRRLHQKGIYAKYSFRDIICQSEAMNQCIATAKKAALTDYTVLLCGESGTGKELFAQSIHNFSQRKNRPFLAINCAALPENLLESELFGYEPGAFTGAQKKGKPGLFEQANTGTIFLDEIGDISPGLQSRLLRVLQEKQIMRISSDKIIDVDVRVITATNQDLKRMVAEGKFRQDLYYRLCVIPLEIPPLRARREDIIPLLKHFTGTDFHRITEEEKAQLSAYDWPGNVRELENAATFFKALGSFPPPVSMSACQQSAADAPVQSPVSASPRIRGIDSQQRIQYDILNLLYTRASTSHSTGRPEMLRHLQQNGTIISDGRLRIILSDMEAQGLIRIEKGRRGTSITDAGIQKLDEIDAESAQESGRR
ncbi:MAG: sigma 54-interacting transcriptional regulator [Firmicutes bacterium]|nr:sigma 54-interacting transcriptional regulator [Bacillota bacterium]MDY5856117.1 sigma 54-interacting transcriptional regulator [Anaerovoracaceae bacterium]